MSDTHRATAGPDHALPYPSRVIEQAHPDRLAVLARLFGIAAPPAQRCRVLELGCGTGVNLCSIASGLPDAEVVGIDLSPAHVASAVELSRELALRNASFSLRSILDVTEKDGAFDYIVCHGVYSWVPAEVRAKILDVCAKNLAPNGIAFVSYNTYPGWHARRMARDMMRFHVAPSALAGEARVDEAVAFLSLLRDQAGGVGTTYGALLDAEVRALRGSRATKAYAAHDHLAEHNEPVYFHELEARARGAGLAYVTDADLAMTLVDGFAPDVRRLLAQAGERVRVEQYIDFVSNRAFRGSLFCRAGVAIDTSMRTDVVTDRAVSAACGTSALKVARDLSTTPVAFENAAGRSAQVADPLLKLAMATIITSAPLALGLGAIVDEVIAKVRASARAAALEPALASLPSELHAHITHLVKHGFVRLRGFAPAMAARASARACPVALPIARAIAPRDEVVPNAWHESVALDPLERALVPHLDGTNDTAALARLAKSNATQVGAALERLARAALLAG